MGKGRVPAFLNLPELLRDLEFEVDEGRNAGEDGPFIPKGYVVSVNSIIQCRNHMQRLGIALNRLVRSYASDQTQYFGSWVRVSGPLGATEGMIDLID